MRFRTFRKTTPGARALPPRGRPTVTCCHYTAGGRGAARERAATVLGDSDNRAELDAREALLVWLKNER